MDRNDELSTNVANLVERLGALVSVAEEALILAEWIVQNREELREILGKPEAMAETVSCSNSCDAACDSLAEAVANGWTELQEDRAGLSWNYLGCCPACQAEELAEVQRLTEAAFDRWAELRTGSTPAVRQAGGEIVRGSPV